MSKVEFEIMRDMFSVADAVEHINEDIMDSLIGKFIVVQDDGIDDSEACLVERGICLKLHKIYDVLRYFATDNKTELREEFTSVYESIQLSSADKANRYMSQDTDNTASEPLPVSVMVDMLPVAEGVDELDTLVVKPLLGRSYAVGFEEGYIGRCTMIFPVIRHFSVLEKQGLSSKHTRIMENANLSIKEKARILLGLDNFDSQE